MAYYLITICAAVAVLLAYYYILVFNFWKKRNISGPKPVFFFGNVIDIMFSGIALPQYIKKLYETYTGRMIGLYMRTTPVLVLKDPELIKDVLIRDFSKFTDRGFNVHERVCIRAYNL